MTKTKTKPAKKAPARKKAAPVAAPRKAAAASPVRIRASFDAAQTTTENSNHWSAADGLGPNSSLSPDIRAKLRYRSRYERDNNCYFGGLVEGRAAETIGTGPRLQLVLPQTWTDADFKTELTLKPESERDVELAWLNWSEEIGLPDDLILADETETTDGEVYLVAYSNPRLADLGLPQLDIALYEADQCYNPDAMWGDFLQQDGIEFDRYGNPVWYYFLRSHPNDLTWNQDWSADKISADRVFHFFKRRRPRAAHGIPGLTAALPLGSVMRRFTGATLAAAEVQAMLAAFLTNNNLSPDANGGTAPEIEAMDTIPFAKAMLMTLHAGQGVETLQPSQPAPSYKDFKGEVLTECGRSISAPRNVSTGSSAEYNYSSGRLDQQGYQRSIKIRRDKIRRVILDRLFKMWVAEAMLLPEYLPADLPPMNLWRWKWRWDGFASIDPLKDANAAQIRLTSGVTTLEREAGEMGEDWEELLEQKAREQAKKQELGIVDATAAAPATTAPTTTQPSLFPDGEEAPANAD